MPVTHTAFAPSNHAIAMGLHIARHAWDHTVVLTSDGPRTTTAIKRAFEDRFVASLTRRVGRPVAYFFAIEQTFVGHPHVHALVDGTGRLPIRLVRQAWSLGITDVHRYDPLRHVAMYVAKGIVDAPDDYDVSSTPWRALPGRAEFSEDEFRLTVKRIMERR